MGVVWASLYPECHASPILAILCTLLCFSQRRMAFRSMSSERCNCSRMWVSSITGITIPNLFSLRLRRSWFPFSRTLPWLHLPILRITLVTFLKYRVNRYGMPTVPSMFRAASNLVKADYYGYLNADIMFEPTLFDVLHFCKEEANAGRIAKQVPLTLAIHFLARNCQSCVRAEMGVHSHPLPRFALHSVLLCTLHTQPTVPPQRRQCRRLSLHASRLGLLCLLPWCLAADHTHGGGSGGGPIWHWQLRDGSCVGPESQEPDVAADRFDVRWWVSGLAMKCSGGDARGERRLLQPERAYCEWRPQLEPDCDEEPQHSLFLLGRAIQLAVGAGGWKVLYYKECDVLSVAVCSFIPELEQKTVFWRVPKDARCCRRIFKLEWWNRCVWRALGADICHSTEFVCATRT